MAYPTDARKKLFEITENQLNHTMNFMLDMLRNGEGVDVRWNDSDCLVGYESFIASYMEARVIRCILEEAGEIQKHDDVKSAGQMEARIQVSDEMSEGKISESFELDIEQMGDLLYLWDTFDQIMSIWFVFDRGELDSMLIDVMGGELFISRHVTKFREDSMWWREALLVLKQRHYEIEMNWCKGLYVLNDMFTALAVDGTRYDTTLVTFPPAALVPEKERNDAATRLSGDLVDHSSSCFSRADALHQFIADQSEKILAATSPTHRRKWLDSQPRRRGEAVSLNPLREWLRDVQNVEESIDRQWDTRTKDAEKDSTHLNKTVQHKPEVAIPEMPPVEGKILTLAQRSKIAEILEEAKVPNPETGVKILAQMVKEGVSFGPTGNRKKGELKELAETINVPPTTVSGYIGTKGKLGYFSRLTPLLQEQIHDIIQWG